MSALSKIARLLAENPHFKRWFENSKLVDDEGLALPLYHATPNEFDAFRPGGDDPTKSGMGIWLGTDAMNPQAAHNVLEGRGAGKFRPGVRTLPVFARAKNPLIVDDDTRGWARSLFGSEFPQLIGRKTADEVRDAGYDSVLYYRPSYRPSGYKGYDAPQLSEAIVFDPRQIKSAIGNRGTYDPEDPRFGYARGGLARASEMYR